MGVVSRTYSAFPELVRPSWVPYRPAAVVRDSPLLGSQNQITMLLRCLLVWLTLLPIAEAQAMPSPKAQCEQLLNAVLPIAKKLLSSYGEFYPFGASMRPDGAITQNAAYDGRQHPPSQPLLDLLHGAYVAEAKSGAIIASAIVYDVRTIPPGRTEKTDAIAVELDHRDNYSIVVFVPYVVEDGTRQFLEPFATKGNFGIFGSHGG